MPAKKVQTITEPPAKKHTFLKRVVLVDDDIVGMFVSKALLKANSFAREIIIEQDPFALLASLRNAERLSDLPDLIFLHMESRYFSGVDFLEQYSQLPDFVRNKCKIATIASPISRPGTNQTALHPAVFRCLIKPIDAFQLKDFMNQ